jgi:hypothetical protein
MSKRIVTEELVQKARIVEAPIAAEHKPTIVDRSFEMPSALYMASAGLFLAFLGIMFAGFSTPRLIIPMVIFTLFIVGFYGLPAVWTSMKPDNPQSPMTMGKFARDGIMTNTGRLNAREATIQMLILPVLIVIWGLAVVTIAALV